MVRVVHENNQQELSDEQKKMLSLIGLSIDNHPHAYQALLRKFGDLNASLSGNEELKDKVLLHLGKKNPRFNGELAKLLKKQLPLNSAYNREEEHFSGADISNLINSASALVGSLGSGKTQKAVAREEMKKSTYEKMLDLKSQSEKIKVEQQASSKQTIWIPVGITFAVLVVGIGATLYFTREKSKAA